MADEEKTNLEGQSFRNEALTGSGTITPDGEYAEPLADPTEQRGISARRTSGGRLLPDLPSEEVETSEKFRRETSDEPGAADVNPSARKATTPKANAKP